MLWRMVAVATLCLGFVLLGGPGTVGIALADCHLLPGGQWKCSGGGGSSGGGGGGGDSGPTRVPHDTFQTPACMTNGPPPNPSDAMCANAASACRARNQQGILMRYYVQWTAGGPWELVDTRCSGGAQPKPVTPAEVRAWLVKGWLPAADVGVSPGNGRTLIDFPTIFYTQGRAYDQTRAAPGGRGQVRVIAEQSSFIWAWGDGKTDRTSTPGVAYSPGTSQSAYVTHNYATTGTYTVDVDVAWTARFQVNGGAWQNLGTITVTRGQGAPVTVLQKRDVLSNG